MADNPAPAAPQAGGPPPGVPLIIEGQYIKDLSFENPSGFESLALVQRGPRVGVEINTQVRPLANGRYEVSLFIRGEAQLDDKPLFIVELTYAGLFFIQNIPEDSIQPVLMIEGPRLLFPFARNIVADATRDGGFPPLYINPVDFVAMYQNSLAQQAQQGQATA